MQVTLKLWVSNQVGVDSDCTANYIEATSWKAPSGVTLDTDAQTISGEAEEAWAAYRSLAAAVAGVGHGTDFEGDDIEADEPTLTACPEQLVCEGYTCAAESLARLESPVQETWAGFVASVPSLTKELAEAKDTLTCCVCGADIDPDSDDYECVTTDHGPDHCCTGCEYTGDGE